MKYIGRKKELSLLEERFQSDKFEFGYLYGQRRIGKTTLIEMFRKNKKTLLFYATDSEDIDIRYDFSTSLSRQTSIPNISFNNWFQFFETIDNYFKDEKGLVVIDEYPNIVLTRDGKRKKTDFLSSLQKAIDTIFINRKITLILTGSNVSLLEKEITDSRAPLYKRNTFSLLLRKFEWEDALDALSSIKDENEKAKILILTNTFPYYLSLIDQEKSFDENLDNLFYKQTAIFTDDPSKIITNNIASGGLYASILKNISYGNSSLVKLSEILKTDTSKVSKYITELVSDIIIRKRYNFNSNRNIKYEISDPMLAYYYRFIRENSELIKTGYGNLVRKDQENGIKDFIDRGFESLCLTYLEYLNKNSLLNTFYKDFGNLRYDNTSLNRSIELDIVASKNKFLLVAECKFSKNKRPISDYHELKEDLTCDIFNNYPSKELYLFGSSGFSNEYEKIKSSNIKLIDLKTMFNK